MTKLDEFKRWARQKKVYSTPDILRYGLANGFTSVDVRARKLAELGEFHRRIPDSEARQRGLVKEGNKAIRWYEILPVRAPQTALDERGQVCLAGW